AVAGTESAQGPPGPAASLELWLNKATDPSMSEQDWSAIQNFCEQVNTDPNGPTHAPWLLAHKIQSPQEKEALYALTCPHRLEAGLALVPAQSPASDYQPGGEPGTNGFPPSPGGPVSVQVLEMCMNHC
ncbi:GGA2 isoform 10, partial [Pan troglodytes]